MAQEESISSTSIPPPSSHAPQPTLSNPPPAATTSAAVPELSTTPTKTTTPGPATTAATAVNAHQQNGDDAPSKSPAMSNPQPPGGPPRQPMAYPTSTAYPPSVTMAGHQFAYPTAAATTQADPYRPIHTTNPVPLPSIRSMDHMQSQPAPLAPGPSMAMGVPMMPGYYVNPNPYGLPPDASGMGRYALPPNDPRLLGPRGPKKVCRNRVEPGLCC
jgi:hypothetical protein